MFPSLERCKLSPLYRSRKCTMKGGFFYDVLGWLQLILFSFFSDFLGDIIKCVVCLSHTVFHFGRNLVRF